ncbi:hypothetical protein LV84_03683 [Algoriphagus ratkowskyi]|uniref:Uncharacterized protein n=1 Tax=Algoriphagus ratkowskyi TaxID=57028 RepID=A0A2W7QWH4_9BACT|nr:hypothetical protein [Algoriphagus ratkowskyi]PZX51526.1 hypothetical protein LV84_03683 [Algoriphagus ratkowskyi]TXD78809.1 hypothetical protein ESW18_04610 [Algoriphagus ratkowskyi]
MNSFELENNTMKVNYEQKAKKNIVKGELGYGIMWLFLSLLIEMLIYFEGVKESYYHILAFILLIPAVYKFVIAIKKYRNIIDEKM